ncbi:The BTB (BR-C, ttk and bab)/POZ (Pox virus and Zinc finger) domain [Ceratobasidium sp. AG-Ba]|nr:The BTB (BR-C, ttk and bab)/POZ (Pox virus and Zinc finger) domain [Ceratobasidium sp. AG-Ba]QRW14299.1 The BTB (BR-C, ttk and bab)/POZ (Pox virus and Zinc finger) domain [Ceratobasidium sp. AG-Ba]
MRGYIKQVAVSGCLQITITFCLVFSMSTDSGHTPEGKKRHSKFFFDNTLVVIEIEHVLFNVHKYQLMKSETFADMFKAANKDPEEGSSVEKPIVLEGVKASDFECLLTVLYATRFSNYQPAPEASLIIPAFRLANKWGFEDLRSFLLPLAEKELNDVDKIMFAREFDIDEWLAPAHTRLCQRKEALTSDEAKKLGTESLLLILRIREEFYNRNISSSAGARGNYCAPCCGYSEYGNSSCNKCGAYNYLWSGAYPNSTQQAQPDETSIQSKVQKWIDEGCSFST